MIVGIFGDSFAEPTHPGHVSGWPDILKLRYSWDIRNFAKGATSLFWSYQQMLLHINEVDCVVFSVTSPGRLYTENPKHFFIANIGTVEYILRNNKNLSMIDEEIFKAAKQYHLRLADFEFDKFVHEQIIKNIKQTVLEQGKKFILLPVTRESLIHQTVFQFPLVDLQNKTIVDNFGKIGFYMEKPTMMNHMTAENNEILASKMDALLKGQDVTISMHDFVFKVFDDRSVYWEC